MSRIRQIKPAFFKDPDMAALPPAVRLFYIGLWTLADDAGYYRWDVAEVGVELYGFDGRKRRETDATAHLESLVRAGRVTRFECPHIFIPTLVEHQRLAGPTRRVLTYEREHLTCTRIPAVPRVSPQPPDDPRPGIGIGTGIGTERKGTVEGSAGPLAPDGAAPLEGETESDFRRRAGLPDFMAGDAA